MMLLLLSPTLPVSSVVGSLLAYRGTSYLLSLLVATVYLPLTRWRDRVQKLIAIRASRVYTAKALYSLGICGE